MSQSETNQELERMDWGDLALDGVLWADNGKNLILKFSRSGTEFRLDLKWARGLRLTIENEESVLGSVLSWSGRVVHRNDGAWEVEFDFADCGRLYVVCGDVSFTATAHDPARE
jgi:hypothetical protein